MAAANFLGLAEIRIAAGDTPGALELLRRLVVALENPFANLDSAAALLEKTGHNKEAVEFLKPLSRATPWEPSFQLRLAKARIAAGQEEASGPEALVKIVASRQAPYHTRVEAALALAGARPGSDFGSEELKLLARSPRELTVEAANQSFFYDARLKAAQVSGDPHVKLQLLGNALAETSGRDDARIPAFQAAAATLNQNEYALAVIEQLLRQQHLLRLPIPESNEEEEILSTAEAETGADNVEEESSRPMRASEKLSPLQQAQVVRLVGEVMTRLSRLNEALPYLQLAQKREKAPVRLKEIRAEIANVRARLRREHLNAARRPILHADLEQDRLVRPRMMAQTTTLTKPNLKAGAKP